MLVFHRLAGESHGFQIRLFHIDAQFFVQLSHQPGFRSFPGFNLAAWKLPEACHWLALRPLLHQNPALFINERGGGDKQICRIFFHYFIRCKDFVNPFL